MREFIYYSRTAPTSGSYIKEDLQKSGRIDIAIHTIIAAFFLSNKTREDVKLHLLFAGPPNTPRHLEIKPVLDGKTGIDKIYFVKSNIASLIKKMLYKFREGERREVFPGFWIEEKTFLQLVNEMNDKGKNLYVLDPKGEDIRKVKIESDPVFILGDHHGLPLKELKRLKKICTPITVGPATYFASQTIVIVNNELDRREANWQLF